MKKSVHGHVDDGDQCGDDQDVNRDAGIMTDMVTDQRHASIAERHDQRGGNAQTECIHYAGTDGQQRAHTQNLHHAGVLFP